MAENDWVSAITVADACVRAVTEIYKVTADWLDEEMSSEVAMTNVYEIIKKVSEQHGEN